MKGGVQRYTFFNYKTKKWGSFQTRILLDTDFYTNNNDHEKSNMWFIIQQFSTSFKYLIPYNLLMKHDQIKFQTFKRKLMCQNMCLSIKKIKIIEIIKKKKTTHYLELGSFSFIFSSALISSLAASLYFSTFLMILRAINLSLKSIQKGKQ